MHIVSVVPDVSGLDRVFDYLVPDNLIDGLEVGCIVRVPLHGRRVRGWVVERADASLVDSDRLKTVIERIGCGPSADVVGLAKWTAEKWCGRWRNTLLPATPPKTVPRLPVGGRTERGVAKDAALAVFDSPRTVLVRRGPQWDIARFILRIASRGPVLLVVPTSGRASTLATELRRAGLSVAVYPEQWAQGAGGVDVVVGARSAAFASIPQLSAVVVVDEHDDMLQESRNPTWHAREVSVERARRAAIPCFLLSPIPSVAALLSAGGTTDSVGDEAAQWPVVEVVDRTSDEQWSNSLVSSRLVELARDPQLRIVVVLNVRGRSRMMACGGCRTLATCERCSGMMAETEDMLVCTRCGTDRPLVCLECGATSMRNLRPGIKRLGEDLFKASGRSPGALAVVDAESEIDQRASLFVGTEAAIHRVRRPDVVVFIDVDQELFAPRYRAAEITAGLVISAARAVGEGRVVLQTRAPRHPLMEALRTMNLESHLVNEYRTREELRLPPFSVHGSFGGPDGAAVAEVIAVAAGLDSWVSGDETVVRFTDTTQLASLLEGAIADSKIDRRSVRLHIDPPRV